MLAAAYVTIDDHLGPDDVDVLRRLLVRLAAVGAAELDDAGS